MSRRKRYWLKWLGPKWSSKSLRSAKATMGKGRDVDRMMATAHVCRHRGFFPESYEELCRLSGVAP